MVSKTKAGRKPDVNSRGQLCFTDLHRPILPLRFKLINALLSIPMKNNKLTVDGIVKRACKLAGLSDFGDEESMPFREPLGVFLEDANAAHTTPIGKVIVRESLAETLASRLKIVQLVKDHPEILHEVVDDPVCILGVPRSGTTHLHRALANCSAFRSLKVFELLCPVEGTKNPGVGEKDPRCRLLHWICTEHLFLCVFLTGTFAQDPVSYSRSVFP